MIRKLINLQRFCSSLREKTMSREKRSSQKLSKMTWRMKIQKEFRTELGLWDRAPTAYPMINPLPHQIQRSLLLKRSKSKRRSKGNIQTLAPKRAVLT